MTHEYELTGWPVEFKLDNWESRASVLITLNENSDIERFCNALMLLRYRLVDALLISHTGQFQLRVIYKPNTGKSTNAHFGKVRRQGNLLLVTLSQAAIDFCLQFALRSYRDQMSDDMTLLLEADKMLSDRGFGLSIDTWYRDEGEVSYRNS
jgi:hypothetical protein